MNMTHPIKYSDESVYFYTFHKCASTLFSNYVLPNADGLKHIDYAKQVYRGAIDNEFQVTFEKTGHIYGPIRISVRNNNPVRKILVNKTIDPDFIHDKKSVFLLRDPRDILVSSYYSFGISHVLSPVAQIRSFQDSTRASIQDQSIDEYVLAHAEEQIQFFNTLGVLLSECQRKTVLRYEEMINNFELFSEQLRAVIPLRDEILQKIRNRSRPKPIEDPKLHRRSGRVGGFRDHLRPDTIESLNDSLRGILAAYGYSD